MIKTLITILALFIASRETQQTATSFVEREQLEDGTIVINTTKMCSDVWGYGAPVPLEVYIKGDSVVKIVCLDNKETDSIFEEVKAELIDKWIGLSLEDALSLEVDAVTGATLSSDAVINGVQRAVKRELKERLQHK